LELKDEYEKLKEAQEKATESSAMTFNKKKTVSAEMKQFREQKEEAERFKLLISKKVAPSINVSYCYVSNTHKELSRRYTCSLESVPS
jgi:structural maintenance of chromosome 1